MTAARFQLMTENGYNLLECASALQKCIRRGMIEESLFWAAEIETKFPDYLWVRLTVIANEDIGLASIGVIEALRTQYEFLRRKSRSPSERLVLANAILALCTSSKTRAADDLQTVVYRRRIFEKWRLEVPDFALDQHTGRGRSAGRAWDHWEKEGLKLDNEKSGLNVWAGKAMALRKKYGKLPKKSSSKGETPAGNTPELFP